MNNYKNLINKNDLKVNKVTIKSNQTIIDTPLGLFILKKNKSINTYNYLLSRGFNYLPMIIDYDNDSILFEYIEDIDYDISEKAKDFIKLLTLLHNKTSYFIGIVPDDINKVYDDVKNRLIDLNNYYNKLINEIDTKEYPSPNEYLLSKNISIILSSINYCFYELDNWKELMLNNNKKRVVTNYNNKLDTMIKTIDNMYLTDLDNVIVDSPVLDLISFYNEYYDKLDFISLLNNYEKLFPLLKEEKIMFFILISIPDKISVFNTLENIDIIKRSIDKIYKTLDLLNSQKEKETSAHKNKDNE